MKEKLIDILNENNYILFSLKKIKDIYINEFVTEIIVDKKDHSIITVEEIEKLTNTILTELDSYIKEDDLISISSIGIDYPIDDIEQLNNLIGYEINFTSPQYKGLGIVKSIDLEYVEIEIKDKTRKKILKIKKNNLSKIRLIKGDLK